MKNAVKIIGIILLVAGSVVSAFTDIAIADYISIAVAALGLALLIVATFNKSEKKTWKEIVAVILFAAGGLLCGFAGLVESTVTQVITLVAGAVALIIGLIATFKPTKGN